MRYGIITHYDVMNHGAILQLYGLVQVLRQLGVDAKALQYERNYKYTDEYLKSKYKIGIKSIFYYLGFIYKRGLKNFFFLYKKKRLLKSFKSENNLIGGSYNNSTVYDGIIIGSDEVFSLYTGLTPPLFGYGLPSKKVFSYAGSFGSTTIKEIDNKDCREYIHEGLGGMCGLSMRDKNSVEICENILGIRPIITCDPVILYDYKKELHGFERPIKDKYMIIYAYDQNMNEPNDVSAIMKYGKDHGLKVISPGFYHKWVDKSVNVSPIELLNWFHYADFVVTDTFHGCVMSIITGRDMAITVRDNGNKLNSLMEQFGLEDRQLNDSWDIYNVFSHHIDWREVNERMVQQRSISMNYLERMIAI